jgi:hypothetical protein
MGVVYLYPVRPPPEETASRNFAFMPDDPDLTVCESVATYVPRNPEATVLYGVVAGHLEMFVARQRERDRSIPWFVEKELRSFLECGILANGFVRVHCDDCHQDRLVPFSCYPQRETICSSPLRTCYFVRSGQGCSPDSFCPASQAMSLSSTWNTPRRRSGGKAFSIA